MSPEHAAQVSWIYLYRVMEQRCVRALDSMIIILHLAHDESECWVPIHIVLLVYCDVPVTLLQTSGEPDVGFQSD